MVQASSGNVDLGGQPWSLYCVTLGEREKGCWWRISRSCSIISAGSFSSSQFWGAIIQSNQAPFSQLRCYYNVLVTNH